MMRSLAYLLLAMLAVIPAAEANPLAQSPAQNPLTLVRQCIEDAVDPEACVAEIITWVNSLCSPGMAGCFLCVEFTAVEAFEFNPRELVGSDPLGEVVLRWQGYSYEGDSHDKLVPGIWSLQWSTSDGIMCSADLGDG